MITGAGFFCISFYINFFPQQELIRRTLAIQEKIYGPDHHLIASTWLTLAKIYQAKGKYTDAEILYNQALTALEKTFAVEHCSITDILEAQVEFYKAIGNTTKATQARERAEQIRAMNQTKSALVVKAG